MSFYPAAFYRDERVKAAILYKSVLEKTVLVQPDLVNHRQRYFIAFLRCCFCGYSRER